MNDDSYGAFTIGTFNVASLISQRRKVWLKEILYQHKIDIICLQETKVSTREQEIDLVSYFQDSYYCYHAQSSGLSAGTAIFLRKASRHCSFVDCELAADGRTAAIDVLVGEELVRIVSIYAPNNSF